MANDGEGDAGAHPSLAIQSLEAGRITEAEGHAYEAYIKRGQEIEAEVLSVHCRPNCTGASAVCCLFKVIFRWFSSVFLVSGVCGQH